MLKGYVHPDFRKAAEVFRKQIPVSKPGGAALCVYHRGECVIDVWAGTKDDQGTPWEKDTVSVSYSTTKGVVSTAMHILVDKGLADYEDPVCRYWPEFARAGKESITIRQLMCHEAGLWAIRRMIERADQMLDWDYMISVLASAQPIHEPGKAHGYHGLTYGWLVGEVIQCITGKKLSDVIQEEIAGPLELDGLYIGLPKEEFHRRAFLVGTGVHDRSKSKLFTEDNVVRMFRANSAVVKLISLKAINLYNAVEALSPKGMLNFDFNSEEVVSASIPAANGMFTARSLAKMYAMMANGGELNGVKLLSGKTLARACTIQNKNLDAVVPVPMRWRMGYHQPFALGVKIRKGFGHFGFGGSGGWADPVRNLSLGMVVNSGVGTPFGDIRIVNLSGSVVRCADRRAYYRGNRM